MAKKLAARRESALKSWTQKGGSLGLPASARRLRPELYPYFAANVDSVINYGALFYLAIMLALVAFAGKVGLSLLGFIGDRRGLSAYVGMYGMTETALFVAMLPEDTPGGEAQLMRGDLAKNPLPGATIPVINPRPSSAPTVTPSPTLTPSPTVTASPTHTATPTITPFPGLESFAVQRPVKLRVGYFYPPLGGLNCPEGVDDCASLKLATGEDWLWYVGQVAACPVEFGLNSWLVIDGLGIFRCAHHLGLTVCDLVSLVCDIAILSPDPVVEDWRVVRDAVVHMRRQ